MRTTLFLASASLIAVIGACKGQETAASAQGEGAKHTYGSSKDAVFFSLERTPCFGKCPNYTVTIDRTGRAAYEGKRFAEREGSFTGQVSPDVMARLVERAQEIGFFNFKDVYDGQVTDLPSTIIRVNADGKDKTVKGRYQSPAAFKPFAAYADSLLSTVQWAPVAGKP